MYEKIAPENGKRDMSARNTFMFICNILLQDI